jgi:predicted nucleic acid-binding protein
VSAVANASPLIALGQIGLLHLLPQLYGHVFVPEVVYREAVEDQPGAPGAWEIVRAAEAGWVTKVAVPGREWQAGEDAVIELSLRIQPEAILLDDLRARNLALREGLPVTGSVGVLIEARRRGLLESAAELTAELRARGFRVSEALVDEARRSDEEQ